MKKTRIAIVGLGGVGGYFGGLLAEKYYQSGIVEVVFIVRPATEKIIKERGLKLLTAEGERTIYPDFVTSRPEVVGPVDFLICTTKSYDLETSLIPFKDCIGNDTVILPLLNGVDAKARIANLFPQTEIWDGCVYIVSRQVEPGIVQQTGGVHSLFFGSTTGVTEKQRAFENLCINAGIECRLSDNIIQTIWEKFLFISPMASATSYFDEPIGEILTNPDHKNLFTGLVEELKLVADRLKISLPSNITSKTLVRAQKLPFDTTSSMHSDFKKGGKNELETLTGYVVKLGQKMHVETPLYTMIYSSLVDKSRPA